MLTQTPVVLVDGVSLSGRLLGTVGKFSSVDHNISKYADCTVALGMWTQQQQPSHCSGFFYC